jgi:hypothetical protein
MTKSRKSAFTFVAPLQPPQAMSGGYFYASIILPDKILKKLPQKGRLRAKGTFNEAPFSLAIQRRQKAEYFFMVSKSLCRAAKINTGDPVRVLFSLVDPDVVELPEELEAVLEQDPEALNAWRKFTPGYQRSLALYITTVKNVDSRINRALELANKAKAGKLHGQQVKKKGSKN